MIRVLDQSVGWWVIGHRMNMSTTKQQVKPHNGCHQSWFPPFIAITNDIWRLNVHCWWTEVTVVSVGILTITAIVGAVFRNSTSIWMGTFLLCRRSLSHGNFQIVWNQGHSRPGRKVGVHFSISISKPKKAIGKVNPILEIGWENWSAKEQSGIRQLQSATSILHHSPKKRNPKGLPSSTEKLGLYTFARLRCLERVGGTMVFFDDGSHMPRHGATQIRMALHGENPWRAKYDQVFHVACAYSWPLVRSAWIHDVHS